VASFHVNRSVVLRDADVELLNERLGSVVRASSSRFRSQAQNKEAALEQLAQKIAQGLHRDAPRKKTAPSRASKVRRVDEKKARGRVKEQRRRPLDD
jgi:ribosome-associated protein